MNRKESERKRPYQSSQKPVAGDIIGLTEPMNTAVYASVFSSSSEQPLLLVNRRECRNARPHTVLRESDG